MKMILNHLSRGFVHTLLLSTMVIFSSTAHAKQHKTKTVPHVSHTTHNKHTTHNRVGHQHIGHVSVKHKHIPTHKTKYEPVSHEVNRASSSGHHYKATGMASWYGPGFHGRKTASGERFNSYGMTAAHRHLALPTRVRVTNLKNHKQVIVRINDRGPYVGHRLIDLSRGAAQAIGLNGTGMVTVESIS